MKNATVFVTVGTTKFDKLIETVTTNEILEELSKRGYTKLILQIGNTRIEPDCTPRHGFNDIELFRLKPSIVEYMQSADLIISHAGAGSCLEALECKKPLIVVINEQLMDNHQTELADQLYEDKHLFECTCDTLLETLQVADFNKLVPFVNDRSVKIARLINKLVGIVE